MGKDAGKGVSDAVTLVTRDEETVNKKLLYS